MKIWKWIVKRAHLDAEKHLPHPGPQLAKMTNCIPIIGVSHSEKLARGLCPHCRIMLDLWINKEGLELSSSPDTAAAKECQERRGHKGIVFKAR